MQGSGGRAGKGDGRRGARRPAEGKAPARPMEINGLSKARRGREPNGLNGRLAAPPERARGRDDRS